MRWLIRSDRKLNISKTHWLHLIRCSNSIIESTLNSFCRTLWTDAYFTKRNLKKKKSIIKVTKLILSKITYACWGQSVFLEHINRTNKNNNWSILFRRVRKIYFIQCYGTMPETSRERYKIAVFISLTTYFIPMYIRKIR